MRKFLPQNKDVKVFMGSQKFLVILPENDGGKWWWWWWCGSTGGENESREDRMRE